MRKVPPYHLDPFKAGLFVAMPVIDVPIHGKELIGSHMGIPNHNDFIFALDVMKTASVAIRLGQAQLGS